MLNDIQKKILQEVADMTGIPDGAVNIRSDGQKEYRQNSEHITIESKTDKDGIDIRIAPFTKHENVHIPVVLTKSGFQEMVYNDFFVGEGADVRIVAGCGIFTGTTISLSSRTRQCPDHYTIRAGRNLPDKEFRYLRTVIVTAAVYWGFDSMLLLR